MSAHSGGKRTKAAPVLVQETEADTAAAAKAAALLRSEYGRGAIAAYVQGWLGESDVCRSEDIPLENDKDYVMSLLAVLTGVIGLLLVLRPAEGARVMVMLMGASLLLDGALNLSVALCAVKVVDHQRPDVIETDDFEIE